MHRELFLVGGPLAKKDSRESRVTKDESMQPDKPSVATSWRLQSAEVSSAGLAYSP